MTANATSETAATVRARTVRQLARLINEATSIVVAVTGIGEPQWLCIEKSKARRLARTRDAAAPIVATYDPSFSALRIGSLEPMP